MRNVLKIAIFAAATLVGAPAWATPVFTGPTSPYYLDNFSDQRIYVVQGTSVINSFPWAQGTPCTYCEGNLAVTNVVSTNWFGSGVGGSTAGQYTLGGTPTGTSWTGTPPPAGETYSQIYDGTSDGTHNYTVELSNSLSNVTGTTNVLATDLNWQNPSALFSIPEQTDAGVTYDPNNNSLWISEFFTGVITDYSLTGTPLSSFATNLTGVFALAFDPADATLWFSYFESNNLYQYSTSGTLLQSGIPSGLPANSYVASEFALPASAGVPEPATLLLLISGLFGLALMRRRKAPSMSGGCSTYAGGTMRNVLTAAITVLIAFAATSSARATPSSANFYDVGSWVQGRTPLTVGSIQWEVTSGSANIDIGLSIADASIISFAFNTDPIDFPCVTCVVPLPPSSGINIDDTTINVSATGLPTATVRLGGTDAYDWDMFVFDVTSLNVVITGLPLSATNADIAVPNWLIETAYSLGGEFGIGVQYPPGAYMMEGSFGHTQI